MTDSCCDPDENVEYAVMAFQKAVARGDYEVAALHHGDLRALGVSVAVDDEGYNEYVRKKISDPTDK